MIILYEKNLSGFSKEQLVDEFSKLVKLVKDGQIKDYQKHVVLQCYLKTEDDHKALNIATDDSYYPPEQIAIDLGFLLKSFNENVTKEGSLRLVTVDDLGDLTE